MVHGGERRRGGGEESAEAFHGSGRRKAAGVVRPEEGGGTWTKIPTRERAGLQLCLAKSSFILFWYPSVIFGGAEYPPAAFHCPRGRASAVPMSSAGARRKEDN